MLKSFVLKATTALALILSAIPYAQADCFEDCVGMHNCTSLSSTYGTSYCQDSISRCMTTCANKKSYGAIAYSTEDEAFGWSEKWNDQDTAEKTAVANCAKYGTSCKVMVWFYNSCGAVAADGDAAAWGQDGSEEKAKQQALDACAAQGGKKCEIKASSCSR